MVGCGAIECRKNGNGGFSARIGRISTLPRSAGGRNRVENSSESRMERNTKMIYENGLGLAFLVGIMSFVVSAASAASTPQAQTESICNLGMMKGEKQKSCEVPIPAGCTVAQFPGYEEPWADASKAGGTSCEFDGQHTDWKTSIVGTCRRCTTERCSGRFSVMFNCAENVPPASPQPAKPR